MFNPTAIFTNPVYFGVFCNVFLGAIVFYLYPSILFKTCAPVADMDEDYQKFINPKKQEKGKCEGNEMAWDRPFFFAVFNYMSYSLALLAYLFITRRSEMHAKRDNKPVPATSWSWKNFGIISLPSTIDVVSRLMSLMAAASVPGSVLAATKGTRILWTAILGVFVFRNKTLHAFNWAGVAGATVGVILIALSTVFNHDYLQEKKDNAARAAGKTVSHESHGGGAMAIGLGLALGAELIRAFYLIVVEKLVKGKRNIDPVFTGGALGVWGIIFAFPILLVVGYGIKTNYSKEGGPKLADVNYEDIGVTWHMMTSSGLIMGVLAALFCILFIFDVGSIMTSKHLSAVHNAICSIMRSFVTLIFETIAFYSLSDKKLAGKYGAEPTPWTAMLLAGFLVLGLSTMVYNGDLKIPGLVYPPKKPHHGAVVEEVKVVEREVTQDTVDQSSGSGVVGLASDNQ